MLFTKYYWDDRMKGVRLAVNVARMAEEISEYTFSIGKPGNKNHSEEQC